MGFLLVLLLGACTGLRTMTPIAVLCWFAYRNALHLVGWRSFTANIVAVIIFTLMALGEYIGDKLPSTPSRTSPIGLIGRSMFGAFVALLLAQPLLLNPVTAILVGILGALIGTYGGWFVRVRSVAALKVPDWPIAVLEDCLTITFSILLLNAVVTRSALFLGNEGGLLR
ncbi:MAG: DUF4126 family protein [Janthinobacterium lividum]